MSGTINQYSCGSPKPPEQACAKAMKSTPTTSDTANRLQPEFGFCLF